MNPQIILCRAGQHLFDSNKVSENYTVKGDKIRNNENLCRNKPITEHTHNQKSVWMKRSRVGALVKYLPCWTSPTPRRMIYIKNSVGTSDHQHRDSRNNIIGIRKNLHGNSRFIVMGYITRPAEREQSQCIVFAPEILTEALVRDTGPLRVSNNFF